MVPFVEERLAAGERILWVTPPKEVVHELGPRLKKIFPAI
jgi:late competence protein required for DNA uptake (superfamily II DNA/RNA helicase)